MLTFLCLGVMLTDSVQHPGFAAAGSACVHSATAQSWTERRGNGDAERGKTIRAVPQPTPALGELTKHQSHVSSETAAVWRLLGVLIRALSTRVPVLSPVCPGQASQAAQRANGLFINAGVLWGGRPQGHDPFITPPSPFGRVGLSREDHHTEDRGG